MKPRNILLLVLLGLTAVVLMLINRHARTRFANQGGTPKQAQKSESTREVMRDGLSSLNDQPIELHGVAVDQFGDPVTGAKVIATVTVRNGWSEEVEKR